MAQYVDPTDGATTSYVKPSVYQSHLGRIWILDSRGGFQKQSSDSIHRKGFSTWERAMDQALLLAKDRITSGLAEYRRRKAYEDSLHVEDSPFYDGSGYDYSSEPYGA